MIHKEWFILPPAQEWYYRQRDPTYLPLPSYSEKCKPGDEFDWIQMIYPDPGSIIYIPYDLKGERDEIVF